MNDPMIVRVVGCTFADGYPDNLHALQRIADNVNDAIANGRRLAAVLIHNPMNPHDKNAVEVHVPALGKAAKIGHLPAAIAAELAPLMNDGAKFTAEVRWVRVDPDHMDRPGIDITVTRVRVPV